MLVNIFNVRKIRGISRIGLPKQLFKDLGLSIISRGVYIHHAARYMCGLGYGDLEDSFGSPQVFIEFFETRDEGDQCVAKMPCNDSDALRWSRNRAWLGKTMSPCVYRPTFSRWDVRV